MKGKRTLLGPRAPQRFTFAEPLTPRTETRPVRRPRRNGTVAPAFSRASSMPPRQARQGVDPSGRRHLRIRRAFEGQTADGRLTRPGSSGHAATRPPSPVGSGATGRYVQHLRTGGSRPAAAAVPHQPSLQRAIRAPDALTEARYFAVRVVIAPVDGEVGLQSGPQTLSASEQQFSVMKSINARIRSISGL